MTTPRNPRTLDEHADAEALRDVNDRLSRQLDSERRRTTALVAALREGAHDALAGLRLAPVPKPKLAKYKAGVDDETAVVLYSDMQLGKVTPSYTSDIAAERSLRYARKVQLLTDIQRSAHPVTSCRVYFMGDEVEGEFNFPHQPHQLDASLLMQLKNGVKIHAEFLRSMLATFEQVHVVGVIGNHGRIGSKSQCVNPESNSDRMLYEWTRDKLAGEPRLTWNIPYERNERAWYAVDYPCEDQPGGGEGPGFLIFHGDQIPGGANYSDGTLARHIFGWASGAVREPFEYTVNGHHHRPRSFRFNRFRGWGNGSFESTNTFAQERLAAVGFPEQFLLFCHKKRGVTAEYLVALGED